MIKSDGIHVSIDELIKLSYAARQLRLRHSQKQVATHQTGEYISRFRGRGIDFNENRIYQPGDDIRTMDWRVTAKTGVAHTKIYHEEREKPVFFLVDYGQSMRFATRVAFKSVIAAQATSILAWLASFSGDRVGGIIFNDCEIRESKPKSRKQGVLPLLKILAEFSSINALDSNSEMLSNTLQCLSRIIKPGSLIYLISDFNQLNESSKKYLSLLKQHNEIICIRVFDPIEETPPPKNRYAITNGHQIQILDTRDKNFRQTYQDYFKEQQNALTQFLKKIKTPLWSLRTDHDIINTLTNYLAK